MSNVSWIKINIDILNDNKMKLIDSMPEADAIFRIWVGILSLAGQSNKQGMIFLSENISYTDEMLSTLFNRPINVVRLALDVLMGFEMLEIFDNGVIFITNWEKHQNLDKLEKIREQGKIRSQKHRDKAKSIRNVTITQRNATDKNRLDKIRTDKNRKEEITKEKRIEPIGSACNQDNNQIKKEPAFQTRFRAIWNQYYLELKGVDYFVSNFGAENKNLKKLESLDFEEITRSIQAYIVSDSFLLKDNKTVLNFIKNYNHDELQKMRSGNTAGGGIGARTDEEAKNDMDYLDSLHDRFIAGSETL